MTTFIQHEDINVGPGHYKFLLEDQLLVTSIFYTIQGEGPMMGHPAIFIRLSGCDRGKKSTMGCLFCDTEFSFSRGKPMSFLEITNRIIAIDPTRYIPIVISGGEPMLQDNLSAFLIFLYANGFDEIQIESNGDRLAEGFSEVSEEVILVVSPKTNKAAYQYPPADVMERADYLKFLIEDVPGSAYYSLPEWIVKKQPWQIFLQPITVYNAACDPGHNAWDQDGIIDYAATGRNYKRAAAISLAGHYRISMQMHLFLGVE
jgi:7-carboxy-7-deazaguanine synthase